MYNQIHNIEIDNEWECNSSSPILLSIFILVKNLKYVQQISIYTVKFYVKQTSINNVRIIWGGGGGKCLIDSPKTRS